MTKTTPQARRLQRHPQFFLKPLALAISLLGAAHTAAYAAPGITDLGTLGAGNAGKSGANGVNAAGDVVVGQAYTGSANHAFRWTQAGGMVDMGTLAASNAGSSVAYGVNAAGDVVVGDASNGTTTHAFRWTLNANSTTQGTMSDLGTLTSGNAGFSRAYGVNAAGDVVVGYAGTDSGYAHAFRWTLNAGSTTAGTMTDLGTLKTGNAGYSGAYGVNAAGNVVVGWASTDSGTHAFRWTLNSGSATQGTMADLGTLTGGTYSCAYAVNAAGDVVVGRASLGSSNYRAFRWTQATGMQSVEDWLKSNGVTVNDSASKTYSAYGVNAAGDVVVGVLTNNHAFIATTKGLLDQVENNKSLAGSSGTPARAMQDVGMVMHGAHGSPMRGLLTAGKQSFWTAGDWGHSDNQGNDGNLGAVEVGYARGVTNDVMVKFALGRTYSKQDTLFGGNAKVDGTYVMPEIIAKVSGTPLYASVSGYYNWGDSDVTRGYDNAGTREFSRGSADARTAALRARLDWLDAFKAGNTAFTPYTSVTYTRTKIDAYTETGGAFPASWNSRTEHSTEARLGLDAVHRVDDKLNVLGRLEGVHRFNDTGAAVSGDVAGLYGFNLPGQTYKRNWLRAAIGFEGKVGAGTASMMLNGSTQSDGTKYWVAANYRYDF